MFSRPVNKNVLLAFFAFLGLQTLLFANITFSQPDSQEIQPYALRGPASVSVSENPSYESFKDHEMVQVDLGCLQPEMNLEIPSTVKRFRFFGRHCGEAKQIEGWQAQSHFSHEDVSLFQVSPKVISSDYIRLKEGENRLELSWKESGMAQSTVLTISTQQRVE